jgi:ATP-dependent exoDNAse (exonuclease V) alpha subunit
MSKEVTLSKEQYHICDQILEWYFEEKSQFITLGGYAGTGKSTLIGVLRELLAKDKPRLKVAFLCFTGKASWNLKNKIIEAKATTYQDSCSTIHSLIYQAVIDERGHIEEWLKKDTVDPDLLIIDEASMVDEDIWTDLISYGKPIIAVGDHGQLPPIKSSFSLMKEPDLKLEKIHRQAEDNPIIKLSIEAREKGVIPVGDFAPKVRKLSKNNPETEKLLNKIYDSYDENTLVLCATNKKRIELNHTIRERLGFHGKIPLQGERVICLKNNRWARDCPVFNGMMGYILGIKKEGKHWYQAEIKMDNEPYDYIGKISKHMFNKTQQELLPHIKLDYKEIGDQFDFGYALTVHKAQGSEADRVVVFEENLRGCERKRWLYTAVTRAKKELYIISR